MKRWIPKCSRHFSIQVCSAELKAFLATSEMIASMLSSLLAVLMLDKRAQIFFVDKSAFQVSSLVLTNGSRYSLTNSSRVVTSFGPQFDSVIGRQLVKKISYPKQPWE